MSAALDHSPNGQAASPPPAVEWALLDRHGVIVAVNDAWRAFSAENGGDSTRTGIGVSYLDVCDSADDAGRDRGRHLHPVRDRR